MPTWCQEGICCHGLLRGLYNYLVLKMICGSISFYSGNNTLLPFETITPVLLTNVILPSLQHQSTTVFQLGCKGCKLGTATSTAFPALA